MNAQLAIMHAQYAVMHAQYAVMHAQHAIMHDTTCPTYTSMQFIVCARYLPCTTHPPAACISNCGSVLYLGISTL